MEEQEISGEGRQESGVAKRDKDGVRDEGWRGVQEAKREAIAGPCREACRGSRAVRSS